MLVGLEVKSQLKITCEVPFSEFHNFGTDAVIAGLLIMGLVIIYNKRNL